MHANKSACDSFPMHSLFSSLSASWQALCEKESIIEKVNAIYILQMNQNE